MISSMPIRPFITRTFLNAISFRQHLWHYFQCRFILLKYQTKSITKQNMNQQLQSLLKTNRRTSKIQETETAFNFER
jgi:hypothetical protein